MIDIDAAFERFNAYHLEWKTDLPGIQTEQDVRFRIVNVMLTEILGWPANLIKTEPHVPDGYIDYLMTSGDRNLFLVEAKKVQTFLVDTKNTNVGNYKVSGPALKSASSAIRQAEDYCVKTGTPLCCVTNGIEWLAHWSNRADGRPPSEYKIVTFPSLDAIASDFACFFDLFSYTSVIRKIYKTRFNQVEGLNIYASERLRSIRDLRDTKQLTRSNLARDLDPLFKAFFSSMSGENDPEMLAKCFVQSKESRDAEASLEKIAKNLIDNIQMVSSDASLLQSEIESAVEFTLKEFVLIIGNKGAGKSTFINRFFDLVLEKQLRDKCLLLKVDLRDSDGDISSISTWLTDELIGRAEKSLFQKEFLTYEDLQGLFFRQYQSWSLGEYKHLYESDKNQFKIKFGEYVHDIRANDRKKYLDNLLWHATGARKLMPCLVFDNTDHYSQDFQETVFQYAQGLHRSVFSFVICPITDHTIWQLSKAGPLQSYETKAFYLPIPSTKEVLQARILFIREKIHSSGKAPQQYLSQKGIRLSIRDIQAFAACIEEVFINTEYVSRALSWLCNFDIRRSLLLTGRILASPYISIDDLVRTYISGNRLKVAEPSIRKALLLGDYNQYKADSSEFVLNLFSISSENLTTPLARLSILHLLKNRDSVATDAEDSYLSTEQIYSYFDAVGINEDATRKHLEKLLEYRCVEPYDPTEESIQDDTRVRITSSGLIHIEFALTDPIYMEHVALTSEVRESTKIDQIRQLFNGHRGKLSTDDWRKAVDLFSQYCLEQDKVFCSIPNISSYEGQLQFRREFANRWKS